MGRRRVWACTTKVYKQTDLDKVLLAAYLKSVLQIYHAIQHLLFWKLWFPLSWESLLCSCSLIHYCLHCWHELRCYSLLAQPKQKVASGQLLRDMRSTFQLPAIQLCAHRHLPLHYALCLQALQKNWFVSLRLLSLQFLSTINA